MSKEVRDIKTVASSTTQVKSLTRGLMLLSKIAETPYGISLSELALQTNLPNSTVHRLLLTLSQHGFVVQIGDLGLWCIGVTSFNIGSAFFCSRDLMNISQPIMHKLMEDSGETVNLIVLDRVSWQAVLIGQVQCRELMRMIAPIGGNLPIHASGGGKAILSSLNSSEIEKLIKKTGLPKLTDKTIIKTSELFIELDKIRSQGFSFDDEEHAIGLRCVAAPIYDELGQVHACVSISGPKSRISDESVVHIGSLVIKAAKQISSSYGGFKH